MVGGGGGGICRSVVSYMHVLAILDTIYSFICTFAISEILNLHISMFYVIGVEIVCSCMQTTWNFQGQESSPQKGHTLDTF